MLCRNKIHLLLLYLGSRKSRLAWKSIDSWSAWSCRSSWLAGDTWESCKTKKMWQLVWRKKHEEEAGRREEEIKGWRWRR